ncbi:unnamed protein product [Ectocarpus sp. 4 AP-2014]
MESYRAVCSNIDPDLRTSLQPSHVSFDRRPACPSGHHCNGS